jgi:hypothetical protein
MSAGRPSPNSASAANYEPPSSDRKPANRKERRSLKSAAGCGVVASCEPDHMPERKSPSPSPISERKSASPIRGRHQRENEFPEGFELYTPESSPEQVCEPKYNHDMEWQCEDTKPPAKQHHHYGEGEFCKENCDDCRKKVHSLPSSLIRALNSKPKEAIEKNLLHYLRLLHSAFRQDLQPGVLFDQHQVDLLVGGLLPDFVLDCYRDHPDFEKSSNRGYVINEGKTNRRAFEESRQIFRQTVREFFQSIVDGRE